MSLIDKSALVAEIERIKNTEYNGNSISDDVACCALDMVIDTIDTLEVKEVDLEKEIREYLSTYWTEEKELHPFLGHIAKHFFELGLKAIQKGEEV